MKNNITRIWPGSLKVWTRNPYFSTRISNQDSKPIFYITPYIGAPKRGHGTKGGCGMPVCALGLYVRRLSSVFCRTAKNKPTANKHQQPTSNSQQEKQQTKNKKSTHFQCLSLVFAVFYFNFNNLKMFFWKPMCFLSKRFKQIKQKIQKNPPSRQPVKTRDGRRTGRARAGARAD